MATTKLVGLIHCVASLAMMLGGCLEFDARHCTNGIVCPPGTTCSASGICVSVTSGCGNGDIEDEEECDDGNFVAGDGCSDSCLLEICGNGIVDVAQSDRGLVPAEECDDGNALSLDGCSASCELHAGTWESYGVPQPGRGASGLAFDLGRRRAVLFDGERTWEWDGVGWLNVTPLQPEDSPPPIRDFVMAYDSTKQKVLLVGGDGGGTVRSDTWLWDGVAWVDVTPQKGQSPTPLGPNVAMAYDPGRQRMVLRRGGTLFEWDGENWYPLTVGEEPSPQSISDAMVYDPKRGRIVLVTGTPGAEVWEWDGSQWTLRSPTTPDAPPFLFGTSTAAYDPIRERIVFRLSFDDSDERTWEWDGSSWFRVTPGPGEERPPDATDSHLFYDLDRRRMLFVVGLGLDEGSEESQGPVDGTWAWDGSQWSDVSPPLRAPAPPASFASTLAFDELRGRAILFGGLVVSEDGVASNQTWAWDGNEWAKLDTGLGGAIPPERFRHAMVYDPIRDRVVLFGGLNAEQLPLEDTWEWDGSRWTEVTPSTPGDSPPSEGEAAMFFDSSRQTVVAAVRNGFSDTVQLWEWDGSAWTELVPSEGSPLPPARETIPISYDPLRQRAVLFGGIGTEGELLQDTWEWDGERWAELLPAQSPNPRLVPRLVFDAASQKILLFGGAADTVADAGLDSEFEEDLWAWDGTAWTLLADSVQAPSPRLGPAMTYDSARNSVVVFGGGSHQVLGDTWEFSGGQWADRTARLGNLPLPRDFAAMEYDAARGRSLLFGGFSTGGVSNELWEHDRRGWSRLGPSNDEIAPRPRMAAATCFDRARQRLVVFGGLTEVTGGVLSDTWEWDGDTWLDQSPPAASPFPSARAGAAMAYDAARRKCLLFGGQSPLQIALGAEMPVYHADTWEWDGTSWTQVSLGAGPLDRSRHRLTYDDAREKIVLFGGTNASIDELGDTWEWDGFQWSQLTPSQAEDSPPAMADAAMSYDSNQRRVILFGGPNSNSAGLVRPGRGELWDWDGRRWTKSASARDGQTPPARAGHAMAYDATRGRAIVFGGNAILRGGPAFDDTWYFSLRAQGPEECHSGVDVDRDGLVGCADPDCWGSCTPKCPPNNSADWPTDCSRAVDACGDGVCNASLESSGSCPADCGAADAVCGNVLCEVGEDEVSCPGDCHG